MPKVRQEQEVQEFSTTKPSLSESLWDLTNSPYAQNIIQRGEVLADELRTRGERVASTVRHRGRKQSQQLAKYGEHLRQDLGEYSEQAAHEFAKRREQAAHELARFSDRTAKRLSKKSEKAARSVTKKSRKINKGLNEYGQRVFQGISEQDGRFWALIGFGIGLVATTIAMIFVLRKRMQQPELTEEEHVLLKQNGNLREKTVETARGTIHAINLPREEDAQLAEAALPIVTEEQPPADQETAKLVGVASSKRYYPIGTPQQLTSESISPLDIVYFESEAQAQAEGYIPAE
ncbi:hypothetical protein [Ktedonobacter racemifer]|uniref:Uncharacterized protein n=1 Tax=Ktedonobacter racemifer DSM 44963 TaxID=485913 RepID=D6TH53_KTERA|nr:hypothetical protein [Ktedonobacter racemifer]EFH90795.1 hypothetical protein Krac_12434 [Ktedonobacter racemifer DSM 44963]